VLQLDLCNSNNTFENLTIIFEQIVLVILNSLNLLFEMKLQPFQCLKNYNNDDNLKQLPGTNM